MKRSIVVVLVVASGVAHADSGGRSERSQRTFDPRELSIATNLGLIQPLLLGGANVEADVRYRGLVIGYSHGWSLDIGSDLATGAMRDQGIALHLPVSTGFGVGPSWWLERARSFVDVRVEGKMHRFEASVVDGEHSTLIASYTTWTLGGGAYWTFMPFARRTDAMRGLNASFSVRVWPKIATSLENDRVTYVHPGDGRMATHEAANIGIANTPVLVNVSVGYVFQ